MKWWKECWIICEVYGQLFPSMIMVQWPRYTMHNVENNTMNEETRILKSCWVDEWSSTSSSTTTTSNIAWVVAIVVSQTRTHMLVGGLVRISSWLWIISRLQWNHRKNAEYYAKCMADSFHQWLWFNDLITMHNMENVTRGHERENEFSNRVGLMSGVQSRIWRYHVAELLLLLRNKDLSHACCWWFGSHLAENKSIQSRNNGLSVRNFHPASNTMSVESGDERINHLNASTFDSHSIILVSSAQVQPTITFITARGRDSSNNQQRRLSNSV